MTSVGKIVNITKSSDVPTDPIDGCPTLVYWNICGLANAIRLALQLAKNGSSTGGIAWVDARIDAGDPSIDKDSYKKVWMDAKPKIGGGKPLASPNLPYLLDGDVALTQSDAILRYLGRKYPPLYGPPGTEHVVDFVLDELKDLEDRLATLSYVKGNDFVKEWYETTVVPSVPKWLSLVMGDNDYVAGGEEPSIGDCKLYIFLRKTQAIEEDLCPKVTSLVTETFHDYMTRMEEHPSLKDYLSSPQFLTKLNNPHSKWNH